MGLAGALAALGLAPAGAVYFVFLWLDRKSSKPARDAISKWTRAEKYNNLEIRIFNHRRLRSCIYLSFIPNQGISSSATITMVIYLYWWYSYLFFVDNPWDQILDIIHDPLFDEGILSGFVTILLSDYFSLFIVRRFLQNSRHRLIPLLLLSAGTGVIAVFSIFLLGSIASSIWFMWPFSSETLLGFAFSLQSLMLLAIQARPALLVHLWLPSFAVGMLGVRVLQAVLYATGKTQWFLKDGSQHPIEAAGLVAAAVVLIATGVVYLRQIWIV